jgi:hypothetical protein
MMPWSADWERLIPWLPPLHRTRRKADVPFVTIPNFEIRGSDLRVQGIRLVLPGATGDR